jgi:hypothetical protein
VSGLKQLQVGRRLLFYVSVSRRGPRTTDTCPTSAKCCFDNMADKAPKEKQYDDWRNIAFVEAKAREAAQRRSALWQSLAKWVADQGAWVVSLPNARTLRIETRRDSHLASKLAELGYVPRMCNVSTRLTPNGFVEVDTIEITLGK